MISFTQRSAPITASYFLIIRMLQLTQKTPSFRMDAGIQSQGG